MRIIITLLIISVHTIAAPFLEWESFDEINSALKKSNSRTQRSQSDKLTQLSTEDSLNMSEYELELYNSIYELDQEGTTSISLRGTYAYNDSSRYNFLPDLFYNGTYFESELGYQLDSKFDDDTLYPNHSDRDEGKARVYNASFKLKYNNWKAGFSRQPMNYSLAGNRSTFLSNNPYSYDKAEINYRGENFSFDIFSALLSNDQNLYRRLYGKHLSYSFHMSDFTIIPGAMESMVVANDADVFTISYLYPIMPSFLNMMNREPGGGNAFIGMDILLQYKKLANLYFQMGIDDFQIDRGSGNVGDEEPDMMTYTVEADLYPLKNLGIETSYKRVNAWVYYVNYNTVENYQHFGKSLGNNRDNCDDTRFSIFYDWNVIRNRIDITYSRYGWQSLNNDKYTGVYWENYDTSLFPVIENGNRIVTRDLGINYSVRYSKYAKLSFGYNHSSTISNGISAIEDGFSFDIALYPSYVFSTNKDFFK